MIIWDVISDYMCYPVVGTFEDNRTRPKGQLDTIKL